MPIDPILTPYICKKDDFLLQSWRPFLPMDMAVWILEEEDFHQFEDAEEGPSVGDQDDEHEGKTGTSTSSGRRGDLGPEDMPDSKKQKLEAATGPSREGDFTVDQLLEVMPSMDLAELLGDGVLLSDWEAQRNAGLTPTSENAPPATVWEHWLLYGPRSAQQQQQQQAPPAPSTSVAREPDDPQDRRLAYAEAVLAGLPADDEAVVISQLALSAGKSLQDVIEFSYRSGGAQTVVEGETLVLR